MPMSIAEQLAYSTVRLQCDLSDGAIATGTAFFYSFARHADSHIPAIVTNRHVIEDAEEGRFLLTCADESGMPALGQNVTVALKDFESRWTGHPDQDVDLAVMPVAPLLVEAGQKGYTIFHRQVDRSFVLGPEELQALDVVEDVTMIGYPSGIWDAVNNMPVFRRGVTATHPAADWNGKPEFLIDAACFPGSSGSPVLLFNRGNYVDKYGGMSVGVSRVKLLGVLYGGPTRDVEGEITIRPVPTRVTRVASTAIPLNLGNVLKARLLSDFEPIMTTLATAPR